MKAFVDPGRDPNMIDHAFYARYLAKYPLEPSAMRRVTFNKAEMPTLGEVALPVDPGAFAIRMHGWYDVENSQCPTMLRKLILRECGASRNYGKRSALQGIQVEPFHWNAETEEYVEVEVDTAMLCENTTVKVITVASVETIVDESHFRWAPRWWENQAPWFGPKYYIGGTFSTVKAVGKIWVPIINPTGHPIELIGGFPTGIVEEVDTRRDDRQTVEESAPPLR